MGRQFATLDATLHGFAVYRVADGLYPVMVEAEASDLVDGVVYLNLDEKSLAKLDEYESGLYERWEVEALARDGERLACQAYVLPATRRESASDEAWDREWFQREALGEYLRTMGSQ